MVNVGCYGTASMWFAQLESYGEAVYMPLAWATIVMLTFYFVTSSDSGSHVVDCHASNGAMESPPLQKIYWSLTEGATAIVLMMSNLEEGKVNDTSLKALQAVSIIAGVPITVLICFYCVSLLKYCDAIYISEHPEEYPKFKGMPMEQIMGIENPNSVWKVVTQCENSNYCIGFGISILCPV